MPLKFVFTNSEVQSLNFVSSIKIPDMATIIKIDSKSKDAKLFLAFARTLRFATVLDDNEKFNAETIKAIEDVEKGKTLR
jgi:hypothetical protein